MSNLKQQSTAASGSSNITVTSEGTTINPGNISPGIISPWFGSSGTYTIPNPVDLNDPESIKALFKNETFRQELKRFIFNKELEDVINE